MKVLFVGAQPDLYGASRMLVRMAACLAERGVEVACVLPEDGPMAARLLGAGAKVRLVPGLPVLHRDLMRSPAGLVRYLRGIPPAARTIQALLQEMRPDIVHTNTSVVFPSQMMAARRCGVPSVLHVREFYCDFGLAWKVYRSALARQVDAAICISRAVAAQFGGAKVDAEVVYDGFLAGEFAEASPEEAHALRRRWGLADDTPVVGIVGRIKSQRKGQDIFLRAAALVARQFSAARFVIVGAPFRGNESDAAGLRVLSQELGIAGLVTWAGELPETGAAYASMDVVVVASAMPEPLGNATSEAMIQGRPVVATNTGGTPEQVDDGVNGLLVAPNSPAAMADAVSRLMVDPSLRRAMGNRARELAISRFSAARMTDDIVRIYGNVLRRSVAGRPRPGGDVDDRRSRRVAS